MASPLSILQKYWQYNLFRPQQEEIIQSILQGHDTLALLPTGGGKSICYQVPALLKDGVCLVISPLIALMKDQVAGLEKKGIAAAALHSGMTVYEVNNTLQQAADGAYKFLYVSPERLQTETFKSFLEDMHVSMIAVDEAHCISQWGYDFRPPYLQIALLRERLPKVPLLAVTASATPPVEKDIIDKLRFKNYQVFRQPFERANLSFSVLKVDSKINKLAEVLNKVQGSSIVYCRTRKTTRQVAQLLALQGIKADYYHAGLTQEERNAKQDAWMDNTTRVITCTNAFGMGIDKADVRTVVHYDITDCIENYYQEAGRAGRDGIKAYAVLLCHAEDIEWLKGLPDVRFPSVYDIRKVYQSLADYLQIPVGIGEGNYYDFDIAGFTKNFGLDIQLVINTLKVLEQEGHLAFEESIFLPSQVSFIAPRVLLEDFERSHPKLEPVIKSLLRSYEGIYDNRVSINEKIIAKLLRTSAGSVRESLQQLASLQIIEYMPQKETPQIHFLLNRAPAQFLNIDNQAYLQRKQQFEQRVQAVLTYVTTKALCRARYIANYFGDMDAKDCGVCDNCVARKNKPASVDDFVSIEQRILGLIDGNPIPVKRLIESLNDIEEERLWKVIEHLQSEGKIVIDAVGRMGKK